jgi:hypothetical protein
MNYLLLLYGDEKAGANMSKEELDQEMKDYYAYTEEIRSAGILGPSEALHPTSSATTVRVQGGKRVTTHGPFAETKEQLGGFYMIDCKNLDEAIEWAAKCPAALTGSVEVRPVVDFSQM